MTAELPEREGLEFSAAGLYPDAELFLVEVLGVVLIVYDGFDPEFLLILL